MIDNVMRVPKLQRVCSLENFDKKLFNSHFRSDETPGKGISVAHNFSAI